MANEILRHDDSSNESSQRSGEGVLEPAGDRWQLRFTRRFPHSPDKVWRALVESDDFNAWFPFDRDGDLATGATLHFRPHEDDTVVFDGEMTEFRPPSVMEFRWSANETLRFEVEPDGDGARFTLLNVFDELGKATRDAAGWHSCLDALDHVVADTAIPASTKDGWQRLRDKYAARFGPDASTIGPPESHPYAE
jgi:uncharacterized protein YndB with AHSA1/START domain